MKSRNTSTMCFSPSSVRVMVTEKADQQLFNSNPLSAFPPSSSTAQNLQTYISLQLWKFHKFNLALFDCSLPILLSNSLVSSRLNFCNSLLYGLPKSSIKHLQHVQNSLARVVIPSCHRVKNMIISSQFFKNFIGCQLVNKLTLN